jgi:hypothetical protein
MGHRVLLGSFATGLIAASCLLGCKKQEPSKPAPANNGEGALISGRVIFKGIVPPPRTLAIDATCGKLHSLPPTESDFQVGASNGLAEVLVYIEGLPENADLSPPAEIPVLDQKGCVYAPRVLGVMVNQKFRVRNSDPLLHNVHALPKKNKEFNLGQPIQGQINEKAFTVPEVLVRIRCDVHSWMSGYVGVLPHRFFVVTDENGEFRLPVGIPPGKFTLAAAHPKADIVSQEVTLGPGEHKQIELTISPK